MRTYYKPGDWKASCDICGFDFFASELTKRWDGFMACHKCWEPRQPQDFVRPVPDRQAPPWTRPEQAESFVPYAPVCNVLMSCSVAGYATAGCMIAGKPFPVTYYNPAPPGVNQVDYFIVGITPVS